MAATGRTWFTDVVFEAVFYIVVFYLIWRPSTDAFAVCDGISKFGTAMDAAELQAQISGGHYMGDQCPPSSKLVNAGLTRALSSQCLTAASHQYMGLCVALMSSAGLCLLGGAVNDLVLWRSSDGVSSVKRCRLYATIPMTIVGSVCAAMFTGMLLRESARGWTCETNDNAAWVYITVGGGLAVPKMALVLVLMFLRLGMMVVATLQSMGDGQPRFMIHKPTLTRAQVQGAYKADGLADKSELDPLVGSETATRRLRESLRPWVKDFYMKHNPEKVGDVEGILDSYVGHEDLLFHELNDKYGKMVPPPATSEPAGEGMSTFGQSAEPSPGAGAEHDEAQEV